MLRRILTVLADFKLVYILSKASECSLRQECGLGIELIKQSTFNPQNEIIYSISALPFLLS